jgi:hypothetical protein
VSEQFDEAQLDRYRHVTLRLNRDGTFTLKLRGSTQNIEGRNKTPDELHDAIKWTAITADVSLSDELVDLLIAEARRKQGTQVHLVDLL